MKLKIKETNFKKNLLLPSNTIILYNFINPSQLPAKTAKNFPLILAQALEIRRVSIIYAMEVLSLRYRLFLFCVFTTNYAQNSEIVSNTLQNKNKKITLTRPKNRTRDPVLQKISNILHVTIPARLS